MELDGFGIAYITKVKEINFNNSAMGCGRRALKGKSECPNLKGLVI